MINVGLIGAGNWGKNYIKTLLNIGINLSWVYSRTNKIDVPENTKFTHDYKEILNDKNVDYVIIATPTNTHYEIVKEALIANKHVLVEKPFTDNPDKALELIKYKKENKVLMIGHLFLYHPRIIKLKQLFKNDYIGEIKSIHSKILKNYKYSNALWELASHEIYIIRYLINIYENEIKTLGNLNHCYINYKCKDIDIFIEACSNYPKKIRETIIVGSKKTIFFDSKFENEIKIIDNETHISEIILVDNSSSLENECKHFFSCVYNNTTPISSGYDGYVNVNTLQRINEILIK